MQVGYIERQKIWNGANLVTAPATAVAPGPVTVKVVPSMVAAFMASSKVAVTISLIGTPCPPQLTLPGVGAITIGP